MEGKEERREMGEGGTGRARERERERERGGGEGGAEKVVLEREIGVEPEKIKGSARATERSESRGE